ncbi:MAG: penicillin-binding protein 1B [Xanthomonadales bacterium]|nr:penicillin-binding protein 1B [Xanthomonadales bacterium]ODU95348.1 MAG: penicillin-binding protein 1B [Rhodanobacter sp. SCN 66-43]OJY83073.1 MAG: penicillin-binding protein 1B [Xanthomonadales bacterium 66-474]
MSWFERVRRAIARAWPFARWPILIGIGFAIGFVVPYTLALDHRVKTRVAEIEFTQPTRVYGAPQLLEAGVPMNKATLALELQMAGYTEAAHVAQVPGTYSVDGDKFTIASRGYMDPLGGELPRRVRVTLGSGTIRSLFDLTAGKPLRKTHLDPARIATLYGADQEERIVVKLPELPPLLVQGVQAVEDRDFKNNHGIDFSSIARALLADLRAGKKVQGASTITQQLVRNLFLDRNKTLVRKFNEALLSILLDAHYSKGQILTAYCNEVFLGQQGNQAVHGFAAASWFYFGRPVQTLRPQEVALLVGIVQGPSYYDPRRFPDRALGRRNLALDAFHTTGLLNDAQWKTARAAPLDVTPNPQLVVNRFPAFMQVVREQIQHDFSDQQLSNGGLAVYTTLDPAAQVYAEDALDETMRGLGKRADKLEGAVVVVEPSTGHVLAMVGGRESDLHGFNRAYDARRPVGSSLKPFYYLMALTDPAHWSVASLLDDSPISLKLPNGKLWTPQNDDHVSHGQVPMVEALAKSYNLASVNLGMQLGVDRVAAFLRSFGLKDVQANPSLLLGAVDMSPFQLAQLYEFFAADGHALPLLTLRGVLDNKGKVLKQYATQPGKGEYLQAERLVRWMMQRVTEYGTAAAIGKSRLGDLNVAGKTGTSDHQRDSWFSGFTGDRLAVAWMGRDDNQPTHLWGATGALRVWINLFQKLPSAPLEATFGDDIQYAWIDPATGEGSLPECNGAQQYPFIAGYAPPVQNHCYLQRLENIFSGGNDNGAAQPASVTHP